MVQQSLYDSNAFKLIVQMLAHQLPAFMTTREPLLVASRLLGLHAALATKEEVSIVAAIADKMTSDPGIAM